MILKEKNSAHEINSNEMYVIHRSKEFSPIALFLLNKKAQGLLKGHLIPDSLIGEIDSFVKRNNIISKTINGELHSTCPRCLKAHAIKKAGEYELDAGTTRYIKKIFDGEHGHSGYYLDREELIKI